MSSAIMTDPAPDADGVFRVGGTRVTLDTVVAAFREGASAETIADQYPDLQLADVYATIAYYLRNRTAVDAYLQRRQNEADQVRKANEAAFDPVGVRGRLLARKNAAE